MPSNKDAFVRYRAINRCLIDRQFATLGQLIAACEDATGIVPLSKRTIQKDLEDMRLDSGLGFFAPIEYDRSRLGYHYAEKGYSIDKIPLKKEEIQALKNSLNLLIEYKGSGIFNQVQEAIEKLVSKVEIGMMHQEKRLDAFMEPERGYADSGLQHLKTCVDAILNKTVIEIDYQRFNKNEVKSHRVHPCYLREYRNRWYIIGWHQRHQAFSTFSLDRISAIQYDYSLVYEPPPFDPAEYFRHVIGMSTPDRQPEKVQIRVANQQLPFLLSQPIHPSLRLIKEEAETGIIELDLIINYELRNFILGLGADAEVLSPEWLRKEIGEILNAAGRNYLKSSSEDSI